jgi:hypothetical protein
MIIEYAQLSEPSTVDTTLKGYADIIKGTGLRDSAKTPYVGREFNLTQADIHAPAF